MRRQPRRQIDEEIVEERETENVDDAKLQEKREPLLAGPKGGHEKESPRR